MEVLSMSTLVAHVQSNWNLICREIIRWKRLFGVRNSVLIKEMRLGDRHPSD